MAVPSWLEGTRGPARVCVESRVLPHVCFLALPTLPGVLEPCTPLWMTVLGLSSANILLVFPSRFSWAGPAQS